MMVDGFESDVCGQVDYALHQFNKTNNFPFHSIRSDCMS